MSVTLKLGVVMDRIESITPYKDSTFAMLLETQARGWPIFYMQQADLYLRHNQARATMKSLGVQDNSESWSEYGDDIDQSLDALDVILMRKDPPFNMDYIYTTYLLELAEKAGTLIVNKPQSLRDANEKLFTAWFPQCTPESLVTADADRIRAFLAEYKDIILKPLDSMGGTSIFRLRQGDENTNVIIEVMTRPGRHLIMAQRYIPEIEQGDKRILMINGEPVDYALARIPEAGEHRGNLAAGGSGVGQALSERDRWICQQVGPVLREKGLLFVGLDVIGDYLTEINVTSPTCIRELDKQFDLNISAQLMDVIAEKCQK